MDSTADPSLIVDDAVDVDVETPVLVVTDMALKSVLSILAEEDDPESLGLRVEITGVRGTEFDYDLMFDEIAKAEAEDDRRMQDGLTVIVAADSVDRMRGSTLDVPSTGGGGLVIKNPNKADPLEGIELELEGDVAEKVSQLLEAIINPGLAAHGGFATLIGVDEKDDDTSVVYVTMGGGCQGCSMSRETLTQGIAAQIQAAIPEVVEVVDATDHTAGENPFYS